jgi:hypothetical protein
MIGSAWVPTVAACALLAAPLAVSGCGGGSATVNAAHVENAIKADLSTSSVNVTNVDCPSDVPVQKGATFTCSASLSNGGSGKVTVTQEGGNRYAYAFAPGSVQIPGTAAASSIEKSLAAQGAPAAKVTCPQTVIVKVGTTVTCNLSGAQGHATGTVTFTFSEANGTVDPASVKSS